jgi:hypothetical protein
MSIFRWQVFGREPGEGCASERERERGTREKAKDGRTRDEDEEDKGVIQHFEKVDFPASPGIWFNQLATCINRYKHTLPQPHTSQLNKRINCTNMSAMDVDSEQFDSISLHAL